METKTNNKKRRIIVALCSMFLCLTLMGVSVYAALSQTASLTNTITVSTAGQVKCAVTVTEAKSAGTNAITAVPTAPEWGTATLDKASTEDTKTVGAANAVVFNQTANTNWYAYKITLANSSTVAVVATITLPATGSTEIDVWAGATFAGMTKQTVNTALSTTVNLAATNGTGEYYIMVCSNVALGSLSTAVAGAGFNLNISIA